MTNQGTRDVPFSERTLSILQVAGWYPARSVNIDKYLQTLKNEGYEVFPIVQAFLKKFGGLEMSWAIETSKGDVQDSMHFNPGDAASAVYYEGYISKYEERLGTRVCIIGECSNKNTTIMMDAQGKVYGGFDDYLSFFGETGEQAIENIITRQGIHRLEKLQR